MKRLTPVLSLAPNYRPLIIGPQLSAPTMVITAMTEILIYAVLGLGGLLIGGAVLIPGVVSLARYLRLPAAAVAVIVIAGGTSAPELLVSLDAALVGSPGIVWGNLIGSNIANILLVLGLGMLIQPVRADNGTRRQLVVMGGLTGLVWAVCMWGGLAGTSGKLASAGLVMGFAVYLIWLLRHPEEQSAEMREAEETAVMLPPVRAALYGLGGVICLVAGADAFVWSGAALARVWGWPEAVIGMSIIAIGTSLPEIMSVLASLRHKRGDIALGSVVGSNLFNFSLVLGTAGLAGPLPAALYVSQTLMPVLAVTSAVLIAASFTKQPLGVRSGLVFVGFYLAFLGLQLGTHNA